MCETKKEELDLDLSATERREQLTKPDCRNVAVQTHFEGTALTSIGKQTAWLLHTFIIVEKNYNMNENAVYRSL